MIFLNYGYIGRDSQLFGVEEHRLVGGRGDGIRLFEVKNGAGLEFTACADRCLDITRFSYKGVNLSYFSVSGYVAPAYYDKEGLGWLNSFTGGFLTTCGLTHFGAPDIDAGEKLGLHGPIASMPAENACAYVENGSIVIRGEVYEACQFTHKLKLTRTIKCPVFGDGFSIHDEVENFGDTRAPLMLLYHMNYGYPLLDENSRVEINSVSVTARNAHALEDIDKWQSALPPTPNFEEQCYFHKFDKRASAKIVNEKLGIFAGASFDVGALDQLCQWKMMGVRDYVMGLEPGNNTPDGRSNARKNGTLRFLNPGERAAFDIDVKAGDL